MPSCGHCLGTQVGPWLKIQQVSASDQEGASLAGVSGLSTVSKSLARERVRTARLYHREGLVRVTVDSKLLGPVIGGIMMEGSMNPVTRSGLNTCIAVCGSNYRASVIGRCS